MDQLIELLRQIQEIAGVAIDALEQASGGGGESGPPAPAEGGQEPGGPETAGPPAPGA